MEPFLGELDEEKFESFRVTPQNGFPYAQGDQSQSGGIGRGRSVAQAETNPTPNAGAAGELVEQWAARDRPAGIEREALLVPQVHVQTVQRSLGIIENPSSTAGSGSLLYADGTAASNLRAKNELDAVLGDAASSPGGSLVKTDPKRSSLTRRRSRKSPKSGTANNTGAEELLGVLNQSGLALGRNAENTGLSVGNDLEASMDLLNCRTPKPSLEGAMQQTPMRGQSPSAKNRRVDPGQWQRPDQVLNQLLDQAPPVNRAGTGQQGNGKSIGWPPRLEPPNQPIEAVKMRAQPDDTSQLDMESMESLLEETARMQELGTREAGKGGLNRSPERKQSELPQTVSSGEPDPAMEILESILGNRDQQKPTSLEPRLQGKGRGSNEQQLEQLLRQTAVDPHGMNGELTADSGTLGTNLQPTPNVPFKDEGKLVMGSKIVPQELRSNEDILKQLLGTNAPSNSPKTEEVNPSAQSANRSELERSLISSLESYASKHRVLGGRNSGTNPELGSNQAYSGAGMSMETGLKNSGNHGKQTIDHRRVGELSQLYGQSSVEVLHGEDDGVWETVRRETKFVTERVPWFSQRIIHILSGVSQSVISNWIRKQGPAHSEKMRTVCQVMKRILPFLSSASNYESMEDFEKGENVDLGAIVRGEGFESGRDLQSRPFPKHNRPSPRPEAAEFGMAAKVFPADSKSNSVNASLSLGDVRRGPAGFQSSVRSHGSGEPSMNSAKKGVTDLKGSRTSPVPPVLAVERAFVDFVQPLWGSSASYSEPLYCPMELEFPDESGQILCRSVVLNLLQLNDPVEIAQQIKNQMNLPKEAVALIQNQIRGKLASLGVSYLERIQSGENGVKNKFSDNICRVRIKVEVDDSRGGKSILSDRFDWDISNPMNRPEDFAQHMCADLSLSYSNVPRIANAIRKELIRLELSSERLDPRQSGVRKLSNRDKSEILQDVTDFAKELLNGVLDHANERYLFELSMKTQEHARALPSEELDLLKRWQTQRTRGKRRLLGKGRKPSKFVPKFTPRKALIAADPKKSSESGKKSASAANVGAGKASVGVASAAPGAPPVKKRKRGRPRKHPLPEQALGAVQGLNSNVPTGHLPLFPTPTAAVASADGGKRKTMPDPKAPAVNSAGGVGASRDISDISGLQPKPLNTDQEAGERNESARPELTEIGSSSLVEDGSEKTIGSPLDSGGLREANGTTSARPDVDLGFTNETAEPADLMPVIEPGESKLQDEREYNVAMEASAEDN
ncbi:hypothetical protein NDN08_002184 [Rhodosorus marinus]|uniref:Uncharacterized protein n=1 Tax=Rhodosorus marinus TaxID=101924 RepID=A0AAV8UX49_9RHOD|nr:hypothetical protein NDN08_002184 [Rhodosorus marinus]